MKTKSILKQAHKVYNERKSYKVYKNPMGFDAYYKRDSKKNTVTIYIDKTNQKRDWVINLTATKEYISKSDTGNFEIVGAVHSGYNWGCVNFLAFANRIKLINKKTKIFVTGYSYGGGATKVMHAFLAESGYNVTSVAMQGAKTIDSEINSYIEGKGKLITVINGNDIVTKSPFWFVQGGEVVRIGPKHRWWKLGIKFRYEKSESGVYKFFTVPDHEPDNFMKSFKKYLDIK